jgi:hypothetical protein
MRIRSLAVSIVALTACGSSSSGSGDTGGDASTFTDAGGADATAGDGSSTNHDGGTTNHDGSTASDTGATGDDGSTSTGNPSSAASYFPSDMYFNIAVDSAPVDSASTTIINQWVTNGGWGEGHIQVDFSIDVYYADSTSVRAPFTQNSSLDTPDSDIPTAVPIAPGLTSGVAAPGFECDTEGSSGCDDCHYLTVDAANHQLIEVYGATTDGTTFTTTTDCGRSVAIWDWTKTYRGNLRGDVCTSADASGGLMAPTLFTVEEVAAGHIDHAIRFILPNSRIQTMQYVRPVTHGTGGSAWAQTNGVPYGGRFRLKPGFDVTSYTTGAQVVLAAMKKYGIILQDGGNIALTAKNDAFSTLKWTNYLGSHDLEGPEPTDFEMVDASYGSDMESSTPPINFTSYDCTRNP